MIEVRPIDADALIGQWQEDAEYMETEIFKLATYAAINDVKHAPTVEPERKKGKWIPCSEKLPENDESVLATTAWGDVTIAERVYPPINDTCWFIHDGNTNATIDDVVGWRPLPEPYRGKQD